MAKHTINNKADLAKLKKKMQKRIAAELDVPIRKTRDVSSAIRSKGKSEMSEQNPMSILLTIRDDGSYEAYSPTLGAFHTESWDTALETIADWQGRLKEWKTWSQKGSYFGLRAEMAKHIQSRPETDS